jgi:hypothetical protein
MGVAPSPAERARTVVRASPSLLVRAGGTAAEVFRHGTGPAGMLVLVVAPEHPVAARVRQVPGGLPVGVDAADFYPVPLPDRLRGRARLVGWVRETSLDVGRAAAAGGEVGDCVLRVDVAEAVLQDTGLQDTGLQDTGLQDTGLQDTVVVSAAAYAAARPDPLSGFEARLLGHFLAEHPAELAMLATLLPDEGRGRRQTPAAGPVLPVGLDRYGLVLRVRGRDLRLPFGEPLTCAHQLPARMRDLLSRAGAAELPVPD